MNNRDVQQQIISCLNELRDLKKIIALNKTRPLGAYLTKYAIVRAGGTIEQAYKTLISDYVSNGASTQIVTFVTNLIRDSSTLPNYSNVCSTLEKFDASWNTTFKNKVNADIPKGQITNSLDNLNKARNKVAHGKTTTMDFSELMESLKPSIRAMKFIDEILH